MDRRTLLALALSALVLIVWSSLFPPRRAAERQPVPASEQATEASGDAAGADAAERRRTATPGEEIAAGADEHEPFGNRTVAGEAEDAEEGAAVGQSDREPHQAWAEAEPRTVDVVTDRVRRRIATVGGGLVECELERYPDGRDRSRPVDLVRDGQQVLDVSLIWLEPSSGEAQHVERLAGVPFQVVEDRPLGSDGSGARGQRVVLRATRSDGLEVTREYTFTDGSYLFRHVVTVTAPEGAGPPPDVLSIGWRAGMPHTEQTRGKALSIAMRQTMNGLALVGEKVHEWKPSSFEKKGPQTVEGSVRWAAVRNKYFLAALVPEEGAASVVHADGDASSARNEVWIDLPLSSRTGHAAAIDVYAGPSDFKELSQIGHDLEQAVRLGPRILRPLGRFMLWVINGAYALVPNYGLVIILVSVMIRVVLHPLNRTSMRSMKAMQDLQPEMQALRKRYADNPQELNKRMMELYKQHGVNPLGGCLPMLVQMPFLFALYYVLMFSVDLRMAPFVAWIDDLSAPDTIGAIGSFQIHVLPLVMTVVSVLQARSTPKDPRQAAMTQLMPVLFLFLFYNMPSGLVLYWTVMNAMAWIQQSMMNRGEGAAAKVAVEGTQITPIPPVAGDHGGPRSARDGNGKSSDRQQATDDEASSGTDGRGNDGKKSLTITGGGGGGRQGRPQKRRKRR